jgi:hypothetical protein
MPTAAQSPSANIRRIVSAALVLLLHLLLLAALLHSVIHPVRTAAMREIFFQLAPRRERAIPLPAPPLPAMIAPPRGGVTTGAMPTPAPAAPDMRGLGQALFGCAPEILGSLTPEQRSHCTTGFARPDANAVAAPSTHVKDAARWAGALKERNTPGRIPCTYIAVTPVMAGAGGTKVPMAEFVCLHKLLSQ